MQIDPIQTKVQTKVNLTIRPSKSDYNSGSLRWRSTWLVYENSLRTQEMEKVALIIFSVFFVVVFCQFYSYAYVDTRDT